MNRFLFTLLLVFTGKTVWAELPIHFEPGRRNPATDQFVGTGNNVRWVVPIGSPTYAKPVIANGKVLIGTLNDTVYDKNRAGSRSVLFCFDERDGQLLWQLPMP